MPDFYLASRSPRRRELLHQIGAHFETLMLRAAPTRAVDVDEARHAGEPAPAYAERVARDKAHFGRAVLRARRLRPRPVLAADTVVVVDDEVLGKPADLAEAAAFLARLSGRDHEVRTAVVVAPAEPERELLVAVSVSRVVFRALDPGEIARYCATGEPHDKAGGYAIQGRAAVFVAHLEGSFSGVMGLPLAQTAGLLAQVGIQVL